MLKIVRRAEPYLEDLCCKLANESRPVTKKEQNEKIDLFKSDDYFCCNKYFNPDDEPCGFDCGYGCKYSKIQIKYYPNLSDDAKQFHVFFLSFVNCEICDAIFSIISKISRYI